MCEICQSEGKNYRFVNGSKDFLTTQQLYKVFKNTAAPVRLCYIHGIELFMIGEIRFLRQHLSFARSIATRSKKLSTDSDSSFGF